ncbi:hypothetical protein EIP91_008434 [Steccherinum ochraceum]|uniref:Uncharacterized protein n=1 Tax=Steccherinum ochraceum TaxID=92696 RepID=A0A4R0R563_9APHY|nr:hypothetical protein EIP91_008434 [Steccherinum ochraceum]
MVQIPSNNSEITVLDARTNTPLQELSLTHERDEEGDWVTTVDLEAEYGQVFYFKIHNMNPPSQTIPCTTDAKYIVRQLHGGEEEELADPVLQPGEMEVVHGRDWEKGTAFSFPSLNESQDECGEIEVTIYPGTKIPIKSKSRSDGTRLVDCNFQGTCINDMIVVFKYRLKDPEGGEVFSRTWCMSELIQVYKDPPHVYLKEFLRQSLPLQDGPRISPSTSRPRSQGTRSSRRLAGADPLSIPAARQRAQKSLKSRGAGRRQAARKPPNAPPISPSLTPTLAPQSPPATSQHRYRSPTDLEYIDWSQIAQPSHASSSATQPMQVDPKPFSAGLPSPSLDDDDVIEIQKPLVDPTTAKTNALWDDVRKVTTQIQVLKRLRSDNITKERTLQDGPARNDLKASLLVMSIRVLSNVIEEQNRERVRLLELLEDPPETDVMSPAMDSD